MRSNKPGTELFQQLIWSFYSSSQHIYFIFWLIRFGFDILQNPLNILWSHNSTLLANQTKRKINPDAFQLSPDLSDVGETWQNFQFSYKTCFVRLRDISPRAGRCPRWQEMPNLPGSGTATRSADCARRSATDPGCLQLTPRAELPNPHL